MDDEQLTALALLAREGRVEDVEAFVRATQRDVWRFVAHLADTESADDLAQETFLRALRSLPGFAGRSSARTWLLSIARRTVVDRYRYASSRPRCASLADWQEAAEHQLCTVTGDAWTTPWHSVVVHRPDGGWELMWRSEAEQLGRIVLRDGRPSHVETSYAGSRRPGVHLRVDPGLTPHRRPDRSRPSPMRGGRRRSAGHR
ncbi:sigma-70 family RNA polymerase sigma factor [Kitasatospora sp. NPDC056531]|uniref:sigma-70 family RNA polymerase sigma factor n=1 Tax=Kitasatospora sp. NPDC056531 TaxID=3345856 RepID=UPI0036C36CB6